MAEEPSSKRPKWNHNRLHSEVSSSREKAIAFAMDYGLIPKSKRCRTHKTQMRVNIQRGVCGRFRCNKKHGRSGELEIAIANGTWFSNHHLAIEHCFQLMYCYAHGYSYNDAIRELKNPEEGTSCETICEWYNYCREAIVEDFFSREQERGKIGGPGKIVQIDESKFGQRKYRRGRRGRRVEGHWVLGMIEDGSDDLRLRICPDNVRSAAVLLPIIKEHVREGTEIHTDKWRAYSQLSKGGYYVHKVVNHSDPEHRFVAPDGTHTQRIESQWRVVKAFFKGRSVPDHDHRFADWIVEYLWRREIKKKNEDPFEELLQVVKRQNPVPQD